MSDSEEQVILVDAADRAVGTAPKLAAHREGRLHRAISVNLHDGRNRVLLQKRHIGKYHSGGLWTNTCCSHPRPGETVAEAARRRLREEMGIDAELRPLFVATYRADVGSGMTEHEVVHVFGGIYDGPVRPDPAEAEGFAWVGVDELRADVARAAERYSAWFRIYEREHWGELVGRAKVG